MEIGRVPTGQSSWGKVSRQAGRCIPACVGGHVTAGVQAGFKLRSVEYATTRYFFFSVSQDGS